MSTSAEADAPLVPNLTLRALRFTVNSKEVDASERAAAAAELQAKAISMDMATYYRVVCAEQKWAPDAEALARMDASNSAKLTKLEATILDAQENLGNTEVRDAVLAKADLICATGDKDAAVTAYKTAMEKTVAIGQKIDIVFTLIRLGMLYEDSTLITQQLVVAEELMETGGDWDRRNRLKVYKAAHLISVRDFKSAAKLMLDTVSTFTTYEILSYKEFVELTVILCMLVLSRGDLKAKIVNGPEIQEILHQLPELKTFLFALYECKYDVFFTSLAQMEDRMKRLHLLASHRRYYVREMRVLAYNQLLESYRSVTLESLARSFGVSVAFIDRDLSHFVAAKRLHCKIDKVGGIVETVRADQKNTQYANVVKQGDLLLNRIQRLSQFIKV